jgi:hypothetical protein
MNIHCQSSGETAALMDDECYRDFSPTILVFADSAANIDLLPHQVRVHCRVLNDDVVRNSEKVFSQAARQRILPAECDAEGHEIEMRGRVRLLNSHVEVFW